MRVFLEIEYNGKNFFGWQTQKDKRTVQGTINSCLTELLGHSVKVCGSGRTDVGVHAFGQTAHFDVDGNTIPATKYCAVLNRHLPDDIRIISSKEVDATFDARKSAISKTYLYKMYVSKIQSPILADTHLQVKPPFCVDTARQCLKYIVGEKDFRSFCMVEKQPNENTVRTVFDAQLTTDKNFVYFEITANGFLYNMVRIITGTMIKVGQKRIPPEQFLTILQAKDRQKAYKTEYAGGLYLMKVNY